MSIKLEDYLPPADELFTFEELESIFLEAIALASMIEEGEEHDAHHIK